MFKFEVGEKVKCFDPKLYKNDFDTPLSITMRYATVIGRKCIKHYEEDTVFYDVQFEDYLSTNHFESALSKI